MENFDIGIGIAKGLFLSNGLFLKLLPQYFFLCLLNRHQYHFAAITYFSTICILEKRLFVFSEALIHKCLKKISCFQSFENFQVKHPRWSLFKCNWRPFWEFSKKLFS